MAGTASSLAPNGVAINAEQRQLLVVQLGFVRSDVRVRALRCYQVAVADELADSRSRHSGQVQERHAAVAEVVWLNVDTPAAVQARVSAVWNQSWANLPRPARPFADRSCSPRAPQNTGAGDLGRSIFIGKSGISDEAQGGVLVNAALPGTPP